MNALHFCGFSDELMNIPMQLEEAKLRSIISRLYYGVFLEVQSWLLVKHKNDFKLFKGPSHLRVTNCLSHLAKKFGESTLQLLAEILLVMKTYRVASDYNIQIAIDDVNVKIAIEARDEIVSLMQKIKNINLQIPKKIHQ